MDKDKEKFYLTLSGDRLEKSKKLRKFFGFNNHQKVLRKGLDVMNIKDLEREDKIMTKLNSIETKVNQLLKKKKK